jgi:hypothetical protein
VTLARVANKDTQTVVSALIKRAKALPNELYKSLTWDRGKELADHRQFTLATNIDVYFCDPQSPWQRGSNENTNGLLIPTCDDFDSLGIPICGTTPRSRALFNLTHTGAVRPYVRPLVADLWPAGLDDVRDRTGQPNQRAR